MKENSIEETIKQLELILKVRKEQKDIIECAGGSCINCDPDIKALTESIDILSDYKRLQEDFKQVDHECDRLEQKEIKLEKENAQLKEDIKEMYYKEAVITIICDNFNLSRNEVLELLGDEE